MGRGAPAGGSNKTMTKRRFIEVTVNEIKLKSSWFVSAAALALLPLSCTLTLDTEECASDSDCRRFAAPGAPLVCNQADARCAPAGPGIECLVAGDCAGGASCIDDRCVGGADAGDSCPDSCAGAAEFCDETTGGACVERRVAVTEPIIGDVVWGADTVWELAEIIYVEPNATLTIEEGTRIEGANGSALIVRRGGALFSNGSALAPVVFTSARPPGMRRPGDWGGVALLGSAPTNDPGALLEGVEDADKVLYGGSEAGSSCGRVRYTRIEFAGFALSAGEELNSLTLAGCGAGTIVDHVQTHLGSDDGVEVFGGSVDLRFVVITRAQDDSFDLDRGWTGRAQFVVIQQDNLSSPSDSGIEADNWSDNPDATPRTAPTIYNATLVGPAGGSNQLGMKLKQGFSGTIANSIVLGHPRGSIDIQGEETAAQARAGALEVRGSIFWSAGPDGRIFFPAEEGEEDDDDGLDEDTFFREDKHDNTFTVDPRLADPFNLTSPSFTPSGEVGGRANPPDDNFFTRVTYAGALEPGGTNWLEGWTAFPEN